MAELSSKQTRGLFFAIEANLILWLVVLGRVLVLDLDPTTKYMTGLGFIASALLQHWAYYRLFRKAKAAEGSAQRP